ncbi:tripartite tricarboxylate transporter substrate binding protein [Bordetella sp. BOR01]|uniref:Bug family tripartite tricarboxylate transporter substrate binding protein n=1 Tax=Bordetella sp. BOR01 TaxID=2854779 RepID=UPI001C44C624|nr:tripartite tricarboxylate transporter substrate binding protein [Bordetella sp. BOR01]MBV7484595.1 tripartite tricarboxylate transporter substrate binding protein [Bordetella sp. BOR01]
MIFKKMRILRALSMPVVAAGTLLMGSTPAWAQADYPSKPVTVIVPFTAGGSSDITARRVADSMSRIMGQPIVIQNQPSAGGIVGVNAAKRAPRDGYTLVAGTISTHAINGGLYKDLSYDAVNDFTPISRIGSFPNILVVQSSLNVKSLKDLIALAKARAEAGQPLTYASGGVGSTSHLGGELLQQVAGVQLTHVPYKGAAGALSDLLGGRIDLIFGNSQLVLPHIQTGKLIPLAVTTKERSNLFPDVPTVAEVGFPEAEMSVWIGLFAPAGIPPAVADKISEITLQALSDPELVRDFTAEGVFIEQDESVAAFRQELIAQNKRWKAVIDNAGIAMDGGS